MASHTGLFNDLLASMSAADGAFRGKGKFEVKPTRIRKQGGTYNYKHMYRGSDVIWGIADIVMIIENSLQGTLEPNVKVGQSIIEDLEESLELFRDLLGDQIVAGHGTLPGGAVNDACEQGVNGMHYMFTLTAVVGVAKACKDLLSYINTGRMPNAFNVNFGLTSTVHLDSRLRLTKEMCDQWIVTDYTLNSLLRQNGVTSMPCPRLKAGQVPHDDYKDVGVKLLSGGEVQKRESYWKVKQATGLATLKAYYEGKGNTDFRLLLKGADHSRVKLAVPITKVIYPDSYFAYVEDTPENRKTFGSKDVCTWVWNTNGKVFFGRTWDQEYRDALNKNANHPHRVTIGK